MDTGDIILYRDSMFSRWWLIDSVITIATGSPWVHVGIVLKDPEWLGLKGLYLWESVGMTGVYDAVDHETKFGVQVVPLSDRVAEGDVWYRKYEGPPMLNLEAAYNNTHNKPYDLNLIDWLEASVKFDLYPQRTKSYWCSALVTYILTKNHVLPAMTDWTITPPSFLASSALTQYGSIEKYNIC
tara:strand:- start:1242 stop:1793 length:552 start_codon:yes stop_codon:yes gene_type:complete